MTPSKDKSDKDFQLVLVFAGSPSQVQTRILGRRFRDSFQKPDFFFMLSKKIQYLTLGWGMGIWSLEENPASEALPMLRRKSDPNKD